MPVAHATVGSFLAAQSAETRLVVEAVRALVLGARPGVTEHIKWNSPSFVVDGVDRATVAIDRRGALRLVLHQGAAKAERAGEATAFAGDPSGILTWHSDIRASLLVGGASDVADRHAEIAAVVRA